MSKFAVYKSTPDALDGDYIPTSDEKDALPGTSGAPGAGNPYVTDADARNSNARTPTNASVTAAKVANGATDGSNIAGVVIAITKTATAGGGGAPDDVTVYAAEPGYEIIDATFRVTAGDSAGRTAQLRTATGGGGTAYSDDSFDCASTGTKRCSILTTAYLSTMYLRRSDSAIAGILMLLVRKIAIP